MKRIATALVLSCAFAGSTLADVANRALTAVPHPAPPQFSDEVLARNALMPEVAILGQQVAAQGNSTAFDLHGYCPVALPNAVVVVATDAVRTDIFRDPSWIAFAKELGVCLVSVKLDVGKSAQPAKVLEEIERTLPVWIDSKLLKGRSKKRGDSATGGQESESSHSKVPIMLFLSGETGYWLESWMATYPGRHIRWVMAGGTRFADIPRKKDQIWPPGAILSLNAKQYAPHLEHFEELRSANKSNLITFSAWDADPSASVVDGFARSYFKESLSAEESKGHWLNIHSLTPHPPDSKYQPDPIRFGWYPSSEFLSVVKALRPRVWPKQTPGFSRRSFNTKEFAACEMRWIKNSAKPKAVLVVASSVVPSMIRFSPEWMEFAKKRDWAVLLVGLREGSIRSEDAALSALEPRFYKELDSLAGAEFKNLPMVVYAQGSTVTWFQAMMIRQPARYLAWVNAGASKYPAITSALKVPPGMVVTQGGNSYRASLYHFEDLRRSDTYNPVLLTILPEKKPPASVVDGFVRAFLDSALTSNKDSNRWLHLHDLIPPSRSMTNRPDPREYCWFPSAEVLGMWKLLRGETEAYPLPQIAKRTYKTRMAEMPELNVYVRLPAGLEKGHPPKGVVCFCSWQKEETTLVNKLKDSHDYLIKMADLNDLAVVTWNTQRLFPEGASFATMTAPQKEIFNANLVKFGQIWEKAFDQTCSEFKINKDLAMLYGISRGATFAMHLASRYPQRFVGVHAHIGIWFDGMPDRGLDQTTWLLTTGEIDTGYSATLECYNQLRSVGAPAIFKAGANLGHSSRSDVEILSVAYFTHLIRLHEESKTNKRQKPTSSDSVVKMLKQELHEPLWWGDYINHQALSAASLPAMQLSTTQLIALPNESIARAWEVSSGEKVDEWMHQ